MPFTPIIGALATLDDAQIHQFQGAAYSPVDNVVVTFHGDWTGNGLAVKVNSINETTGDITVGASVNTGVARSMSNCQCAYHAAEDKFVFLYSDRNGDQKFRGLVGTVAGTSMNFGSEVEIFPSALGTGISDAPYSALVYHETDEKFVAFFTSGGTLYYSVLSVSGLALSVGTYASTGLSAYYHEAQYNPITNKILLVYGSGTSLYSVEVTISGDTISLGASKTLLAATWADSIAMSTDPVSGNSVVASRGSSSINRVQLLDKTGTLLSTALPSGTGFSWASERCIKAAYDGNTKKINIAMISAPDTYATAVTISGSSISLKTPVLVRSGGSLNGASPSLVFDASANKVFFMSGLGINLGGLHALAFQIDEEAPTYFWTNFSGQSEILV